MNDVLQIDIDRKHHLFMIIKSKEKNATSNLSINFFYEENIKYFKYFKYFQVSNNCLFQKRNKSLEMYHTMHTNRGVHKHIDSSMAWGYSLPRHCNNPCKIIFANDFISTLTLLWHGDIAYHETVTTLAK